MSNPFYLRYVNPLTGLDERRLVALLDQGEHGAYALLQWLYRYIEKRNPVARAVKHRLMSALGKLQWDIKTTDAGEDTAMKAMADKQSETLRSAYDRVTNLRAALNWLAIADLRGFAHLEKIYGLGLGDGSGDPLTISELRIVEQWFWVREGQYALWEYNPGAREGVIRGIPIDLTRFIVREVEDPVNEIIAKLHVRQETADSDWDGYLESFGIPSVIIEGPPNVPPEKEAQYQRTAEQIASDARGYLPNGAKAHLVAAAAGSSVFKERLDYLDGQIVIAATSGKLTILTERGAGTLAGGAQKDAFDEIAQALANDISEAMQKGFDADVLGAAHPDEPILAYFEYAQVDEKDGSKVLTDAGLAFAAGYSIDADELTEKSGYTLKQIAGATPATQQFPHKTPEAAVASATASAQTGATPPTSQGSPPEVPTVAKPPESAASPAALDGTLSAAAVKTATAEQLGVTPDYLAPAQTALDDLLAKASGGNLSNDDLIASAEDFLASLPELAGEMDTTGMAAALEAAMKSATENALQPS